MKKPSLEEIIEQQIGEVRTESLDMTFGEIINLHAAGEFIIRPDYQRLFRWIPEQQSRLVESILLKLPIPQIFVIENEDGIFELIDGLQRVSSIIHFIEPEQIDQEPLELIGCDIIKDLNTLKFEDLPLRLKLTIKRSPVRCTIIKRQSKFSIRYEMFKRLNTGGSVLSPQEIRNCNARMAGDKGINFYSFLQQLASDKNFQECTDSLAQSKEDALGNEEYVLRYLALKNARDQFRGNVREWLDSYQEQIVLDTASEPIHMEEERIKFEKLFSYINSVLGASAFVRFNKNNEPVGGLSGAYYEAVTMGIFGLLDKLDNVSKKKVKDAVVQTIKSDEFREATGAAANTRKKLDRRINLIFSALEALL